MEFTEKEEVLFQQTVEWLSSNLDSTPTLIKQQISGFHIDPFTRTFTNENGKVSMGIDEELKGEVQTELMKAML